MSFENIAEDLNQEGYEEVKGGNVDQNLERLVKKKNTELFLFELPKDMDVSKLDGLEIDLSSQKGLKFELPDGEVLKLERLDQEPEQYTKNQVLPLFPMRKKIGKSRIIYKSTRSISRVYKLRKVTQKKKIKRKNINLVNCVSFIL